MYLRSLEEFLNLTTSTDISQKVNENYPTNYIFDQIYLTFSNRNWT